MKNQVGFKRGQFFLIFIFLFMGLDLSSVVHAIELDPYPVYESSHDQTSISFFREERPSYYLTNIGLPDAFFSGVSQISQTPSSRIYSVRSMEYGIGATEWVSDQWKLGIVIPFETNALEDLNGTTHSLEHFGDLEVETTYLLAGKRQKGNFISVNGSYRFATGTNPFTQTYPLLSTGKGASSEAVGLALGEELGGGFSLFQSIDYEKIQSMTLNTFNAFSQSSGAFQWPENVNALGRIEWVALHRSQRLVSLFIELRMRMSGLMEFNGQPVTYAQGNTTDQLFFPTGGLVIRVDKELTAEGQVSYLPQLDFGALFSLSLIFRPI